MKPAVGESADTLEHSGARPATYPNWNGSLNGARKDASSVYAGESTLEVN
jgi:hypothetical protein